MSSTRNTKIDILLVLFEIRFFLHNYFYFVKLIEFYDFVLN